MFMTIVLILIGILDLLLFFGIIQLHREDKSRRKYEKAKKNFKY